MPELIAVRPVATYRDHDAPWTLTTVEELPMPADITNHAIRRFRSRVRSMPRKRAIRILHSMVQEAKLTNGEALFFWEGCHVKAVFRNGRLVTIMD